MSIEEINFDQVAGLVENGAALIDVREDEEVAADAIDGMTHMPLSNLEDCVGDLPKGKDIILYCRSGRRSLHAGEYVKTHTDQKVYSLRGGIIAYRDAGL